MFRFRLSWLDVLESREINPNFSSVFSLWLRHSQKSLVDIFWIGRIFFDRQLLFYSPCTPWPSHISYQVRGVINTQ